MKRELRVTKDGSSTFFVEELDEHYHSVHGALQESMHVFIDAGLHNRTEKELNLLEIGFGTGLNAWLTALDAKKNNSTVRYVSLEKFPLSEKEYQTLNYANFIRDPMALELLNAINNAKWGSFEVILSNFALQKLKTDLKTYSTKKQFHLIYFDAFAPSAQPELWTVEVFQSMFNALLPGGTLVTYCAKGQVKRNMKAAGFTIEALPGPPGKREMTRARKAMK